LGHEVPPQLIVLTTIAKSKKGLTLRELVVHVAELCRNSKIQHFYTCGKGSSISKEVMLDLNTLKALGLVNEVDGRITISEKGIHVLNKLERICSIHKPMLKAKG